MSTLFAFFGVGHWELIFLMLVVLLLFGNRLPSVMRSLGRGVVEFKRGINSTEDDLKAVEREDERA
jgi:sec-independent protein translocase protein TatA